MKTLLPNPDSTTSFSMKSAKVRLMGLGGLPAMVCCLALVATLGATSALAVDQPSVSQPVILADFNHDGIPDALVQSSVTPTATIAFGSVPYGTFAGNVAAVTFPAACTSLPVGSIAVGDFNGDGFPDIAYFCGTTAGTMLGKGDGTFGTQTTLAGVATSSGIVGDFNHDGKIDIAVLSNEGNGQAIRFLSGNGDGTFNEAVLSNLAVSTYSTLVAADLNGDQYPDLLLIDSPPDVPASLEVLGNNQNGTFGAGNQGVYSANTVASLPIGGAVPLLVGSFFGPATTDVVVVGTGVGGHLFAFKNTSTTTAYSFNDPVTTSVTGLTAAQAGKFTGSGFTDVAVANGTNIAVLANDGAGNFTANYSGLTLTSTASKFAVADANNDGYADIYIASLPVTGPLQLGVNLTTGSATATATTSALAIGTTEITANWAGNVNFTNSTATGSQTVNGLASVTTLASNDNPSHAGDAVTFSVQVAPSTDTGTVPTGAVVLTDGMSTLTSGTLDGNGSFTYSTSSLTQGPHTITATYAGDALYIGSFATVPQMVTLPTTAATATTLTVTSAGEAATTVASGTVVTLTASVTANGNSVAPGQVVFCDATAETCTETHLLATAQLVPGDSTSTATYKFVPGIGSHSYKAVFLGTTTYAGTASAPAALAVTGTYPTSTTIAASGTAGNYTLTATTVGTGSSTVAPTGSVSFLDTSNANTPVGSSLLGPSTSGFALAQAAGSPVAVGARPYGMATGDFNGDGLTDLVVQNYGSGTVSVLLGKGDGTFQPQVTYAVGVLPERVLVADLDGDGKLDLVVANTGSSTISVLLGHGDGTFQAQATYPCSSPVGLGVMDINHDGIPDVVAGGYYSNRISVLLGNGNGTLAAAVTYATGGTPQTVAEGDFNGDGNVDVVVGNVSGATVGVFLGNGDGTFQAMVTYPVGHSPQGVQVGDFNGDGKQDLAVANNGDATISVLLGKGDGTFQAQVTYPVGTGPVGLAIADFNGDGIEDITVGNTGQASLTQGVLLGRGDGTFQPQVTFLTGNFPYGVTVGDFNGDGLPDMAVANFNDATATIFLSQATETATATGTGISPQGTGTHQVVAKYPGDSHYGESMSQPTALVAADITPTVASLTPTTTTVGAGATTITITGTGFVVGAVVQVNGTNFTPTLVSPTQLTAVIPASYFTTAGTLTITLFNPGMTMGVPAGSFNVTKANPVISWATPASIAYGTPLSATQLNATAAGVSGAPLPGTFQYSPNFGIVPSPGTHALTVSFTPTDTTDYTTATKTVNLVVTGVTVASFTPTTAILGSGATTITITGAGFASGAVVRVNGAAIPTTLVSATTVTAVIPASYFTAVSTLTITLSNPGITTVIPVGSFSVTAFDPVPILDVPPTTDPGTQPTATLSLAAPYPIDITATVSLSFAASTTPAIDDPNIVFEASGTRMQTIAIPAGTTTVPPILLQAGTVAGTITVPITLTANGVNVTPANLAPGTIVVPAAVPTVSSVTVTRSGKQLTVVVHGFSNTREIVNAKFHFTPAAGATLGTTDLTVLGDTIFNAKWFLMTASDPYGSTFTYTQVFDLSDDATTVSAVDVTLTNSVGASEMKTAQ